MTVAWRWLSLLHVLTINCKATPWSIIGSQLLSIFFWFVHCAEKTTAQMCLMMDLIILPPPIFLCFFGINVNMQDWFETWIFSLDYHWPGCSIIVEGTQTNSIKTVNNAGSSWEVSICLLFLKFIIRLILNRSPNTFGRSEDYHNNGVKLIFYLNADSID